MTHQVNLDERWRRRQRDGRGSGESEVVDVIGRTVVRNEGGCSVSIVVVEGKFAADGLEGLAGERGLPGERGGARVYKLYAQADGVGSDEGAEVPKPSHERGGACRMHASEEEREAFSFSTAAVAMNNWGEPVSSRATRSQRMALSPLDTAAFVVDDVSSAVRTPPMRHGPCSGIGQ